MALAVILLAAALALPARADEGMWLFNNPPRKLLEDKYQLKITDSWLEHLQKSSVRLSSGGSGSFDVPCRSLVSMTLPTYEPEDCPLCAQGLPVVKPGSRPGSRPVA